MAGGYYQTRPIQEESVMNARRLFVCGMVLVGLAVNAVWAEAPAAERATFTTRDGVEIVGDFYPAGGEVKAPLIVLLHMYRHDRSTWKPLVGPLHDAGFAVLAIDLRGHGESTKPESMKLAERVIQRDAGLFNAMHLDVEAAVGWAAEQPGVDVERLGIVGASVGCSVALGACARDNRVDAVVCLSPGTGYLGINSTVHIKKTRDVPILLLATEDERDAVDKLAKLAKNANGEIVGEGRVHGTNMFGEIDGIEAKIVGFLKDKIK